LNILLRKFVFRLVITIKGGLIDTRRIENLLQTDAVTSLVKQPGCGCRKPFGRKVLVVSAVRPGMLNPEFLVNCISPFS